MKFAGTKNLELMGTKTLLDELIKNIVEDVKNQTLSLGKVGDKCTWTKINIRIVSFFFKIFLNKKRLCRKLKFYDENEEEIRTKET